MIIPIGHDQTIRKHQWATYAIMAVCLLVQAYVSFGQADEEFVLRWGYHSGSGLHRNLILSAFVHDGWLHVIGNMLFLWLVGSVLEDRWGRAVFVGFYLVSAAVATLCFDLLSGDAGTILIGASGAVSASMGAFLALCWSARIRFLYWFYVSTGTFQLPASVALALWLVEQVLWASVDSGGDVTGIAYTAHLGGFGFGLAVAMVARQGWLRPSQWVRKATAPAGHAAQVPLPAATTRPATAPLAPPPPLTAAASPLAPAEPTPIDGRGPRFLT